MQNIFLVHGAWHNEECWDGVEKELNKRNLSVHKVTLAGNEPGSKAVDTSYDEIVNSVVKKAESIEGKFVLVAHSSAGHVIQNAAPYFYDKIEKIVFNNAWLLPDKTSQFDLVPPEIKDGMREGAKNHPRNCIPVGEDFVRNVLANDTAKEIQDKLLSILVPQPLSIMETKSDNGRFNEMDTPMALLHCKKDISLPENFYVEMFLNQKKGDEIVEIEGIHECLYTDPKLFTDGLLKCI